ncbi:MAG TPA: hypothetical protein VM529_21005, partial [Gemmata sp.]|nr:hypothetical protein [Gemmata sp.]
MLREQPIETVIQSVLGTAQGISEDLNATLLYEQVTRVQTRWEFGNRDFNLVHRQQLFHTASPRLIARSIGVEHQHDLFHESRKLVDVSSAQRR